MMTLASNYQCLLGNKCKNVFINNHLMVIKVDFFFFGYIVKRKKENLLVIFSQYMIRFFYGCLRKCKNGNSAHSLQKYLLKWNFLSFKMFFADFFYFYFVFLCLNSLLKLYPFIFSHFISNNGKHLLFQVLEQNSFLHEIIMINLLIKNPRWIIMGAIHSLCITVDFFYFFYFFLWTTQRNNYALW